MPLLPELDDLLHSENLSYGKYARQFEDRLKAYFGVDNLIVTNSFSLAISVAMTTLGLQCGDEVIASPMACLASTQPYIAGGYKVVWADIDPQRGTLDPESVEKRLISSKTKAIIHNHFCGYPGHVSEINAIGKKYGIPVVDDGIECFGSEYRGKKIGNCGSDVTIFSLSAVRIPNTIDGGIVIFKDKTLYEKSLIVRDSGIDRSKFRDKLGEISLNCDISLIGYGATMSDVNGYIGLQQMKYADLLINMQREEAKKWSNFFSEQSMYIPIYCEDCIPNYWVYGVLTDNKAEAIKIFRNMGYYASGVHMKNNIYSVFGRQESLPRVEEFYNHFMALPCGWWMSNET